MGGAEAGMSAAQLPLDLGHRAALGADDFLVAPPNEAAVAWIDRWPDWPGGVLALWGPPASGKSHLVQVWRTLSGAPLIAAEALDLAAVPDLAALPALALDCAEATGLPERPLLHLLNLRRGQGSLLLAARAAPAQWPVALPDLASRLAALPAVRLDPPDDALLRGLLVKLFADRQLDPAPEVIEYVGRRIERSFAAAEAAVAALDAAALAERRPVTVGLARRVLLDLTEGRRGATPGSTGAARSP